MVKSNANSTLVSHLVQDSPYWNDPKLSANHGCNNVRFLRGIWLYANVGISIMPDVTASPYVSRKWCKRPPTRMTPSESINGCCRESGLDDTRWLLDNSCNNCVKCRRWDSSTRARTATSSSFRSRKTRCIYGTRLRQRLKTGYMRATIRINRSYKEKLSNNSTVWVWTCTDNDTSRISGRSWMGTNGVLACHSEGSRRMNYGPFQ